MKIDMHAHFFPRITRELAATLDGERAPWLRVDEGGRTGMIMRGGEPFRPVHQALWDPATCVEVLDRQDVAMQIVCATPIMFAYPLPAERVIPWAQRMNDLALEFAAHAPKRLKVLAQVPLQDIDAACAEASRAKASGHVGVQIGNHLGDRDLDDAGLVTFLHHCADAGIPVLVHPWDMMGGPRMKQWMLPWLVAMPAETQLGILSLILSGAFERLPHTLKICFAHGGGSFAFLLGRVQNAWEQRDIVRKDCPRPPAEYVDRFHVDSAVFDPRALRLLVEVMGAQRVMLGSDHPFPLGEKRIGELVDNSPDLSAHDKERIRAGNALDFFSLDAPSA